MERQRRYGKLEVKETTTALKTRKAQAYTKFSRQTGRIRLLSGDLRFE